MIKRLLAHLIPALAYGAMFNAFFVALLLPCFHGNMDDMGRGVLYFVINGQQWSALPFLAWSYLFLVALPGGLSVAIAMVHPFAQLTTRSAMIFHSIFLLAATFGNLLFFAVMSFAGWNEESF